MSALSVSSLLPLRGLVVTLQCLETTRLSFFHQPALTAFLRFLAGSPDGFDTHIRIDAPESGRSIYQPDNYYRFSLIGIAGSDALLERILGALAGLPESAPKQANELPFRDNWRLHSVQDMFSGNGVTRLSEVSQFSEYDLHAEIRLWSSERVISWQWLSPARLLKSKAQREPVQQSKLTGEDRYVRDEQDLDAELLLSRLHNSIADLLRRRGQSTPHLESCPSLKLMDQHLFWLHAGYRGNNKKDKTMGGVTGYLRLACSEALPEAWLQILILGQYIGMGQRTSFGWGRYVLQTEDGAQSYRRVFPAGSLLSLAQDEESLSQAWRHVMAGKRILIMS